MAGRSICVICPTAVLDAGEIAAAARRLAGVLAEGGAAVTLLLAGDDAAPPDDLPAGVSPAVLPPPAVPLAPCAAVTALSWRCRDWLAEQCFDLVLCPDRGGLAYYPLLARRQRLALERTAIAVLAWGPTLWLGEADGRLVDDFDMVVADYQERRAVELADAVVAPHGGVSAWMQGAGWALPGEPVILPLPPTPSAPAAAVDAPIRDLVYVGGLSRRDGLLLFCAAVERIAGLLAERGVTVTLAGRPQPHPDCDFAAHLAERAARWPFAHRLESPERLAELLGPDRLAVLPTLALGEPAALQACLALGGPLLATDVPGAAAFAGAAAVVPPTPPALAERLAAALESPPAVPRPAVADAAAWHALADRLCADAALPPPEPLPPLLVSVCVTHFNRPQLLERAVASLLAQTWTRLQIIVVDDGSTDPAARARLDALEAAWGAAVTLIRQPNRYLGAARNRAAAEAKGDFLLFMDDDNIALPDEIETMLRAAVATGADVLTAVINLFDDDDARAGGAPPTALWVPVGGCAAGGLYSNVFGDANALIRRSAFAAAGGFSEDFGLGLEDWELFARLALAGARFDVVARPLLWYRQSPGGMLLASVNRPAELARAARGYVATMPAALAPALKFAQGVHYRQDFYRREYQAAAALSEERLAALRQADGLVAERDRTIADMKQLIDERWAAMQEMERMIEERDRALEECNRALEEYNSTFRSITGRPLYRVLRKAGLLE